MKPIPQEPTQAMIEAGQAALDDCVDEDWDSRDEHRNTYTTIRSDAPARIWAAMVAAHNATE